MAQIFKPNELLAQILTNHLSFPLLSSCKVVIKTDKVYQYQGKVNKPTCTLLFIQLNKRKRKRSKLVSIMVNLQTHYRLKLYSYKLAYVWI